MGINGVTLTHLNAVITCDNSANTGASTGGSVGAQILYITQELLSHRVNDTKFIQNLIEALENKTNTNTDMLNGSISQVSQHLGSTEAKVDDMRSVVDEHLVQTLNVSDVLNQVQQTTEQSAQRLVNIANTLSSLQDTCTSTAGVVDDILLIAQELLELHNESTALPTSCKNLQEQQPNSPSGYYILAGANGTYATWEHCVVQEEDGQD